MKLHKKAFGFLLVAIAGLMFILAGCGGAEKEEEGKTSENKTNETIETTEYPSDVQERPVVTMTMEDGQEIVLELFPEAAPNTVANFISLVEEGFYDGLIFHRVIPDFMIQGGDPDGTGTGGPDYTIAGEFSSNGFEQNTVTHERGVISMARTNDPNSASSQFFIMVNEASHLDGEYAAFGKVIEGMETADAIVSVERDSMDMPLEDQKIKTVVVDTKGYDYPEPKIQ
ncbi:peptidyl-prolyl cis-trans isomerase B (cyclophilin B) [Mesobacillus persicus]|uniref:Peptidyl-prolyl cis-trans isomerase n=1 Tax=Mesobacillus persicus TaxID=930146 RepID=A0A1H8DHU7_9BACI|nr:peptidylprolyl isomerase [Mesobacillus persicus]SEN06735.1 peptidyl-prolyl cis-trans isomerase B (cyclophilin B) [Mesobacillus persicus]